MSTPSGVSTPSGTSIITGTKRVLVTGCAGELGRRLVARLATESWVKEVVGVDRHCLAGTWPKLEAHTFDLEAPDAAEELAALGKGASTLVHLAWSPSPGPNLDILRAVTYAAEAIEPSQLVFMSSATVYGAWPDNPVPLTEDVEPRPNPQFTYAVQKRAAELALERWAAQDDRPGVAILRPACAVGPLEQPLYRALTVSGRSSNERMVQYLHVDDLAAAVVHAIEHDLAGVFNVAPDAGIPEDIARALVGGTAGLPLPARLRGLVVHARSTHDSLTGRRWPAGSKPYASNTWVVAADKLKMTGWAPEYSSEEALVVTDQRPHWDDLSQSKRVGVTLGATAALAGVVAAGGAALVRSRRS
ncbi:MAG TPA: NAD-dependent epimerase/dehydratase family protein [Acidimicrobiales bacterium]|nr:NAD-dependent epimerase/dehydratase family protein [Acidimicrobiales bacterium]